MAGVAENDLDWPSSDIMVSYDAGTRQIRYTTISTKQLLKSVDVSGEPQNGDVITPNGIERPYVDLTTTPLWRRVLRWIRNVG